MDTVLTDAELDWIGDLLVSLDNISPKRLKFKPAPARRPWTMLCVYETGRGNYTNSWTGRAGNIMGALESFVSVEVSFQLKTRNRENSKPEMVLSADGSMKLMEKLVRIPDVSFTKVARSRPRNASKCQSSNSARRVTRCGTCGWRLEGSKSTAGRPAPVAPS